MIAYRICERKKDKLYTLFHGICRSRLMPIGEWLTAELKIVRDGGRDKAKPFISGFHILKTLEEAEKFSTKFRSPRDLVIVECEVGENVWKKTHSPYNVFLSEEIKLLRIIKEIRINERVRKI